MMFQGVEVTKVSTNSTRDFIRVSLYSRHLIQKKHIYEVEHMLKQQLFARSHIQVDVREQYELSEQYTPENLMNEYYESFLFELDQKSVVERNMLRSAKYHFENENVLCLSLEDNIVSKGKKDLLTTYLTYQLKIMRSSGYASENILRQNTTNESLKKIDEKEAELQMEERREKRAEEFAKVIENYQKKVY